MGVWWHALAFVTHERPKMSHKPGRNVTQAGPKCHTRAKMSHSHVIIVGLRPALEGFVVTMHEGACETGSQIPTAKPEGFDVLFAQARVHCDNKPRQIGLNNNYNMTFLISPHGCPYSPLKWRSSRSKREPFRVLLTLLRHVAPLSYGKLLSHNAVVKGRCARDAIPWTFHIEVFKCGQDNSDTITRIGVDSVELLDSC